MQLVTSERETSARGSLDSFSKQTIVECIKSGRYDYVSVALTPWHARMAVGSYLKLRAANLVDKGILLIDRHSRDGYLISPETVTSGLDIAYLERGDDGLITLTRALVCRVFVPSIQVKKNKGRVVFVANASFPGSIFNSLEALNLDCRLSYILLDEGVGSYLASAEDWARQSIRDRGLHGPKALIRKWLFNRECYTIPRLIRTLEAKKRFQRFYLFKDDGILDDTNAAFVRRAFELESKCIDSSSQANNKYEGAVVFCSQFPLVEARSISLKAHLAAVDAAYQVAMQLSVPFVLKLHPRETDLSIYSRYEAFIDPRRGIALEDILGCLTTPPVCVTSLCSTAMITASAVFKCPAIGLEGFISDEEVADSFTWFCEKMRTVFSRYYKCPSTIDELCAYLQQRNSMIGLP